MPSTEGLVAESATVVGVFAAYQGQIHLTLDRQRFATSDPHNVNRVIYAWATEETQGVLTELGLQRGEQVIVTTEFSSIEEGSGSMDVPNWPGHDAMEYPVGRHRILSITRASP